MSYTFCLVGGDKRNIYLKEIIEKDNKIVKYNKLNSNSIKIADYVISAIPFSRDGENVNAPFEEEKINVSELISNIKNKTFIAGSISSKVKEELEKNDNIVIDVMEEENLAILNTIATAEGAIKEIIQDTDGLIFKSNILILGFGRVAKTLALKLKQLDSIVTCSARKESDLAWIETYGYNKLEFEKLENEIGKFDIIINTIPAMILEENKLKKIKNNSYILDLATFPGGADTKYIEENNIKYNLALGLPGKVAPKASAEYIYEIIKQKLKI